MLRTSAPLIGALGIMLKPIAIASFCILIVACGPGTLDYTDQIGHTQYNIARTDGRSLWLFPRRECGAKCPVIDRNIVWFELGDSAIAVRRQVVNNYECKEGYITSEWLNKYEQYVIQLGSNELIGPMSVEEYREFVAGHSALMKGIGSPAEGDFYDGRGEVLHPRGVCTDPVAT